MDPEPLHTVVEGSEREMPLRRLGGDVFVEGFAKENRFCVHKFEAGPPRNPAPSRTIGVADQISYTCGVEKIYFSPTVLFQSRLYRFAVPG